MGHRSCPRSTAERPPLCAWLAAVLLLVFPPPSGFAGIDVQAKNGLLTLRVQTARLVEVLEKVSHETGLKVVYEGARPSQLVTVNIEQLSETEALSRLFEGLGVNYAFQTDASGQRVEVLIISGSSGTGPAVASSGTPSRGRPFPERVLQPPEPEPQPELAEDPAGEPPESPEPGMEIPAPGFAPESAEIAPPSFPSEASYTTPLQPFPFYASYPSRAQPPFDQR